MRLRSFTLMIPLASLAWAVGCGDSGTSASTGSTGAGGSGGAGGASTSTSTSSATSTSTSTGQGGSGGGATSTSTSSGSSTSTSSGSSTGAGGGMTCTWSLNNPCGAGMYCDSTSCGQGTCQPVGVVETQDKTPVCGCDGVTYWNTSVAKSHGMSTSAAGACLAGKTCGGFANLKCPVGAYCNITGPDKSVCQAADIGGVCWGLPAMCLGQGGLGPQTRACGAVSCADDCALIKAGMTWYPDNTCPQ